MEVSEEELDCLGVVVSENNSGDWDVLDHHTGEDSQNLSDVQKVDLPLAFRVVTIQHEHLPLIIFAFVFMHNLQGSVIAFQLGAVYLSADVVTTVGKLSQDFQNVHLEALSLADEDIEQLHYKLLLPLRHAHVAITLGATLCCRRGSDRITIDV